MALIDLNPRAGSPATVAPRTSPATVEPRSNKSAFLTYFTVCFGFAVAILMAPLWRPQTDMLASLYCIIIFCLCAGPVVMGRHGLRHRLLATFMGVYFAMFGFRATVRVLFGETHSNLLGYSGPAASVWDSYALMSDAVVVFGALAVLAGYYLMIALSNRRPTTFLSYEWQPAYTLGFGLLAWVIGFAVIVVYDSTVSFGHLPTHVLGLPLYLAVNLRLLSPIGAMMLIYLVGRGYRQRLVAALLMAIIATEFVAGFILNSKENSFRIAVLLLVGLYYLGGKLNKKLLIAMLLIGIPYLLLFNLYRDTVAEHGYRNSGQAFAALSRNFAAVKHQAEGQTSVASSTFESFTQRVDGKMYVDIIVAGTGSGRVPRLDGESIGWFLNSFIPRFIWRDKPDSSIGQRFNRAFHLSGSPNTYVPTTILGEFYWNFGMAGVAVGMLCVGMVFGRLAGALLDQARMTVPRFVTLLMSTYYLAVRFEDNMANIYSTFLRLLVAIWLADQMLRLFGISSRLGPPVGTLAARESPSTFSAQPVPR
jgi:hypothetical protein